MTVGGALTLPLRLLPLGLLLLLLLLLQGAASVAAAQDGQGETIEPRVLPTFDWVEPFPADGSAPNGFGISCQAEHTFHAKQYTDGELSQLVWQSAAREFLSWHDYQGSWGGWDRGPGKRDILLMEWREVPEAAQAHIEELHHWRHVDGTKKWWQFGLWEKPHNVSHEARFHDVQAKATAVAMGWDHPEVPAEEKVLMLAPASLYDIIPLMVAKDSACEAELKDLNRYNHYAKDQGVIGWPEHTPPDHGRHVYIKAKAYLVHETEETKKINSWGQKVRITAKRQERKMLREERKANRKSRDNIHVESEAPLREKDEL